jgi:integral membrane protein
VKLDFKSIEFLKKVSYVEGFSLIILFFIAMPIKYILGEPLAVRIVGTIHGLLWLTFLYALYTAHEKNRFEKNLSISILILSVIPFGFIYIEKYLNQFKEKHLAKNTVKID